MYFLISFFIFCLALDQITKFYIEAHMVIGEQISIIPHYFYLTYIKNPGAAFGLLANFQILFIIIAILILSLYIFYIKKILKYKMIYRLGITMVVAGAIGNMIDRVRINYVIDFFDLKVWPIFNVADIFICIGSVIVIYYILMGEGE